MNKEFYKNWIQIQKKSGRAWFDIINLALVEFNHKIPEQKPKLVEDIYMLFSCLAHELDTPAEVHSLLLDIMLYCEGEDTGFYDPYTKEALLGALKSLIEKHNQ